MNAHEWFIALLGAIGSQSADGKSWQCPAHHDSNPSLSVRPGPGGSVRVKCFGGCGTSAILAAVRCSRSRLAVPPPVLPAKYVEMVGLKLDFPKIEVRHGNPESRGFRLEAQHDYGRAVLFRYRSPGGSKELSWETRLASGALVPGFFGITLADLELYREAEIRMAIALGEPIALVESESSVDALKGIYSTTWAGGARAINVARIASVFVNYPHLVVIPDNDDAGRGWHARLVAAGLAPHTIWPDDGADARDLYRALGSDQFARTIQDTVASLRGGQHSNRRAA